LVIAVKVIYWRLFTPLRHTLAALFHDDIRAITHLIRRFITAAISAHRQHWLHYAHCRQPPYAPLRHMPSPHYVVYAFNTTAAFRLMARLPLVYAMPHFARPTLPPPPWHATLRHNAMPRHDIVILCRFLMPRAIRCRCFRWPRHAHKAG